MDFQFILGKLAQVMNWDDEEAPKELARTHLMARLKYDSYQGFIAGARYVERLVDWLQQFPSDKRRIAYDFVRDRLIYLSSSELNHLVDLLFPDIVEPMIVKAVSAKLGIDEHLVWSTPQSREEFRIQLRKSLFVELSDGARMDVYRHANPGVISNEQVVTAPSIHESRWLDLRKDLQSDLSDANARFSLMFLVDDFTGSGTSLIRKVKDEWKGKLTRFWDVIKQHVGVHFDTTCHFHVHHYLATQQAVAEIKHRADAIAADKESRPESWFPPDRLTFSFGHVLPASTKVEADPFCALVDDYFDPSVDVERKRHLEQSGITTLRYGYGNCRLPLILEHNTPNNTFPLLWLESSGDNGAHAMRALFQRRERHT